jgi:cell division protein FtsZ
MTGAKGVIISIIGGEDMKLLEIDEAANHIRELVDPEANIIWGSAFNPDLHGKIRVSVVATGIEQSAEQLERANHPLNLSNARGPKKPVLPLPTEQELADDAAAAEEHEAGLAAEESWGEQDEGGYAGHFGTGEEPAEAEAGTAPAMPEAYTPQLPASDEYTPPVNLYGDEEEDDEEDAEESAGGGFASLTGTRITRDPEGQAAESEDEWGEEGGYGADEGEDALELTHEAGEPAEAGPQGPQDELLLDADRLAEGDQPEEASGGRRRRLLGGGSDEEAQPAPRSPGGSTLFERMANLSRAGSERDEDEEEDEGSSSLRIPRFLGRQNNQ